MLEREREREGRMDYFGDDDDYDAIAIMEMEKLLGNNGSHGHEETQNENERQMCDGNGAKKTAGGEGVEGQRRSGGQDGADAVMAVHHQHQLVYSQQQQRTTPSPLQQQQNYVQRQTQYTQHMYHQRQHMGGGVSSAQRASAAASSAAAPMMMARMRANGQQQQQQQQQHMMTTSRSAMERSMPHATASPQGNGHAAAAAAGAVNGIGNGMRNTTTNRSGDNDETRRLRAQLVEKEGQLKMLRDKNSVLDQELFNLKKAIHGQQQQQQGNGLRLSAGRGGGGGGGENDVVDRARRLSGTTIELAAELDKLKSEVHFKDEETAELKERLRDLNEKNARMQQTEANADVAMEELRAALETEKGEASKLRENLEEMHAQMQNITAAPSPKPVDSLAGEDGNRNCRLRPPMMHVLTDQCSTHLHALLTAPDPNVDASNTSAEARIRQAIAMMTVTDTAMDDDTGSSDVAEMELSKALVDSIAIRALAIASPSSPATAVSGTISSHHTTQTNLLLSSTCVLSTLIVYSAPARDTLLRNINCAGRGVKEEERGGNVVAHLSSLVVGVDGSLKSSCGHSTILAFVQLLASLSVCVAPDDLLDIIDASGGNLIWNGALARLITYVPGKDHHSGRDIAGVVEDIRRETMHVLLVLIHTGKVSQWLNSDDASGEDDAGVATAAAPAQNAAGPRNASSSSLDILNALSCSLQPMRVSGGLRNDIGTRGLELACLSVECLSYLATRMLDAAIAKLFDTEGSGIMRNVFLLLDEVCRRVCVLDADADVVSLQMLLRLLVDLLNLMTVGFGTRITDPTCPANACTPTASAGIGSRAGVSASEMMRSVAKAAECVRDLRFTRRKSSISIELNRVESLEIDQLTEEGLDALDWLLGQLLSAVFAI